jgi:hypothetical protein
MPLSRRRLVFEKYYNDEKIPYKIEIYKTGKKRDDVASFWKGILLILALFALFSIFIGSLFLLKWKRPGLYLEDCNRRSCASGFDLKCINSTCQCPSSDFYYTKKCFQKKSYGEYCHNSQEQCKQGLKCFNGICSCNWTQFWTGNRCSNQGSYADNCDSVKCSNSSFLKCDTSSKLCVCGSTRFWSGNACYQKRLYNEICGFDANACRNDLALICLNGFCECISTEMLITFILIFFLKRYL